MTPVQPELSPQFFFELWKAIHGGCWPGPPPDIRISRTVADVVAGLALYNLANTFQDGATRQGLQRVAVESLGKTLPALQQQLRG